MFLIRAAFWLSVVVMLIPADPQTGVEAPRVGAIEAIVAARTAVADISAFCDRNPAACRTGGSAFRVFAAKARYGARLLTDNFGADDPAREAVAAAPDDGAWRDLSDSDRAI